MLRKNRLVGVNYLDIEDMALLTFSPVRFTNRGDYVSLDANRALACIKPSLWMVFKAPWVAHKKKENLGRWTYSGRGWSLWSASRQITISSLQCRYKISTPQNIKPIKKFRNTNINASNLNNQICEDKKLCKPMARPEERYSFFLLQNTRFTRRRQIT